MKRSLYDRVRGFFFPIQGNPNLLLSDETTYFDVDGTLAMWNLPKDHPNAVHFKFRGDSYSLVPHQKHIDLLKKMVKDGKKVIVWSMAGETYARTVCKALKIQKYPYDIMSKPSVVVDDLKIKQIFRHTKRIYYPFGE